MPAWQSSTGRGLHPSDGRLLVPQFVKTPRPIQVHIRLNVILTVIGTPQLHHDVIVGT